MEQPDEVKMATKVEFEIFAKVDCAREHLGIV